ncbi:hypothetical protein ABKV19_026696, partial [Rosa sericea]
MTSSNNSNCNHASGDQRPVCIYCKRKKHIRVSERRFYANRPYWRCNSVIGKSEGICCRGMMWVDEKPYLLTTHEHPNVMLDNEGGKRTSLGKGRRRRHCSYSETEEKNEINPKIP